MNFQEKIKKLCEKYNLCNNAQKEIAKICSDSYIKGSNDCDELTKKYFYLMPKNVKQ